MSEPTDVVIICVPTRWEAMRLAASTAHSCTQCGAQVWVASDAHARMLALGGPGSRLVVWCTPCAVNGLELTPMEQHVAHALMDAYEPGWG